MYIMGTCCVGGLVLRYYRPTNTRVTRDPGANPDAPTACQVWRKRITSNLTYLVIDATFFVKNLARAFTTRVFNPCCDAVLARVYIPTYDVYVMHFDPSSSTLIDRQSSRSWKWSGVRTVHVNTVKVKQMEREICLVTLVHKPTWREPATTVTVYATPDNLLAGQTMISVIDDIRRECSRTGDELDLFCGVSPAYLVVTCGYNGAHGDEGVDITATCDLPVAFNTPRSDLSPQVLGTQFSCIDYAALQIRYVVEYLIALEAKRNGTERNLLNLYLDVMINCKDQSIVLNTIDSIAAMLTWELKPRKNDLILLLMTPFEDDRTQVIW